ncbi:MAG TPA: hypothetical protein VI728_01325, partial [Syntrophales bacterium]|nr:hypothetical protein [Syntrophales bacterium]
MPFTSGTVPGFSGATGLMQTLVNYMAGSTYSDNLGTGNGVTLLFNKMLANTPVAKGNCRVRFKIAGVIY